MITNEFLETVVVGDDDDSIWVDVDEESFSENDSLDDENNENDVLTILGSDCIPVDSDKNKLYVKYMEVKMEEEYLAQEFLDDFRIVKAVRDNIIRYDI